MKREIKLVKKFLLNSDFLLNKMKSGAKREWLFVHIAVSLCSREREIEV